MSNTAANVTVGKPKVTGAVSVAPLGTTLPTNATADLTAAYKGLGYISDAGWSNTDTTSTTDIKAWGGDIVLSPVTEKKDEFKMKLIEAMNVEVLKAVYGEDNVTGELATGLTVASNSTEKPALVWVIDEIWTDGALNRTVIPNGKITDVAEITHKDDTAVGYEITIKALPGDESFGYATHKEFKLKAND